jgi:hypothetical protein
MIKNSFIIIFITASSFLLSMENIWHNPNIKNDVHIDLAQRYFGHESICSLALVNKQWNAFIQQTARHRRKYLASQEEYKTARPTYNSKVYKQTAWHKHNSAYAYWIENSKDFIEHKKPITLYFVYLGGNGNICTHKLDNLSYLEINYSALYERYKAPFFDTKGDVHYYMYAQENNHEIYILDLIMGIRKLPKKVIHYIDITHKNNTEKQLIKENLLILENYPTLFKAFMQSQHVAENDYEKIYHVDGIEIDEDYVLNGRFPRIDEVSPAYRRQYKNIENYYDSSIIKQAIISRCKIKK